MIIGNEEIKIFTSLFRYHNSIFNYLFGRWGSNNQKAHNCCIHLSRSLIFVYIDTPYMNIKMCIVFSSCGWSLSMSSIFVRKQVLRLVQYLVSFGFYNKQEEIKRLLEPMMGMIDGRCDKPYPDIPKGVDYNGGNSRNQVVNTFILKPNEVLMSFLIVQLWPNITWTSIKYKFLHYR